MGVIHHPFFFLLQSRYVQYSEYELKFLAHMDHVGFFCSVVELVVFIKLPLLFS